MNNNGWITDRLPTSEDSDNSYVWTLFEDNDVHVTRWEFIKLGMPWMPLQFPVPYVKRFEVLNDMEGWYVSEILTGEAATPLLSTREDAEKIASIFERAVL